MHVPKRERDETHAYLKSQPLDDLVSLEKATSVGVVVGSECYDRS